MSKAIIDNIPKFATASEGTETRKTKEITDPEAAIFETLLLACGGSVVEVDYCLKTNLSLDKIIAMVVYRLGQSRMITLPSEIFMGIIDGLTGGSEPKSQVGTCTTEHEEIGDEINNMLNGGE